MSEKSSAKVSFPFESIEGKTNFFVGVLKLFFVLAVVSGVLDVIEVMEFLKGGFPQEDFYVYYFWLNGAYTVVGFVLMIAFIVWCYRAYKNLDALGTKRVTTPAWVVWDFLLPIINWFEPYKRLKEIWKGSLKVEESPGFILRLWLLWVFASEISEVAGRLMLRAEDSGDLQLLMFVDGAFIFSGVLFLFWVPMMIRLVEEVAAAQKAATIGGKKVDSIKV